MNERHGGLSRRRVLALAAAGVAGVTAGTVRGAAAAPPGLAGAARGQGYDAYVDAAPKEGQFDQYTCEFDAAWVILATFGRDATLGDLVGIVGVDRRVEPHAERAGGGWVVRGGDTTRFFSGDYTRSFLARTTGRAMRKVFAHHGLAVERVGDRAGVEAALAGGGLIWMKSTVDFLPGEPVTWVTPEGEALPGVLGNDHAVVAIGYGPDGVVVRDALGPTSTNWGRAYEYAVPWDAFLAVWASQGCDGLAVARPVATGAASAP